jgi:hypothetical protein
MFCIHWFFVQVTCQLPMHPFRSSYFLCRLCFIIIIIIIIITIIIIILNLFLLIIIIAIVKFNFLKTNKDMKCVVIHCLLLRAAAVYCLSVHKSLSSVIKILMVPAGYVWMFCIHCTFFLFILEYQVCDQGWLFEFGGTRMLFVCIIIVILFI